MSTEKSFKKLVKCASFNCINDYGNRPARPTCQPLPNSAWGLGLFPHCPHHHKGVVLIVKFCDWRCPHWAKFDSIAIQKSSAVMLQNIEIVRHSCLARRFLTKTVRRISKWWRYWPSQDLLLLLQPLPDLVLSLGLLTDAVVHLALTLVHSLLERHHSPLIVLQLLALRFQLSSNQRSLYLQLVTTDLLLALYY